MAVKSYDDLVADQANFRQQHGTDLKDSDTAAKQAVITGKDDLIQQRDDDRADQLARAILQAGDPSPDDEAILASLTKNGSIDCRHLSVAQANIVVRNDPENLSFGHFASAIALDEPVITFDNEAMNALETESDNIARLRRKF